MRVNYIYKVIALENNKKYDYIIQKNEKGKEDINRPINCGCTIEFMNQTQLRKKFGNTLELLYNLKLLHYNNVMVIWFGYHSDTPMCRVTSMEIAKREVEEYDKDRTKVTSTPTEG